MISNSDQIPQVESLTFDAVEALSSVGDPVVVLQVVMETNDGNRMEGIMFDGTEVQEKLGDLIRAIADYHYASGKYEATLREDPLA